MCSPLSLRAWMASFNYMQADAAVSSDESVCFAEDAQPAHPAAQPPDGPAAAVPDSVVVDPAPVTPEVKGPSSMSAVGPLAVPGSDVVDLELPVKAAPTPKTGSKTSMATPKTMKGGPGGRKPLRCKSASKAKPQAPKPAASRGVAEGRGHGANKRPRAPRGTMGTFAGRRPPASQSKLELFLLMETAFKQDVAARRAARRVMERT